MTAVLMLAALGMGMPPDSADRTMPSPRALFDLYRKNFDGFRTLKVQWRREQAHTEDWAAIQERDIEAQAAALNAMNEDAPKYHELHQQLHNQQQVLIQGRRTKTLIQAFLTDRTRFMMRIAPPTWALSHGDSDWLVPDVQVNPASMKATYAGFEMIAYFGHPSRGFRRLTPQPYLPAGNGMIHRANVPGDTNAFPPLGVRQAAWGGTWHPIDEFFKDAPDAYRTLGRAVINGHETVVLERRTQNPDPRTFLTQAEANAQGERISQVAIVRAYLDPKCGGLPRKIEWDAELFLDGKPMPRPKSSRPYRVIDGIEIVEIKGAGFYPVRGSDRTYGQDPKWIGPKNTYERMIAGAILDIPTTVHEETTWHAAKVEGNVTLNEDFELPFADGSYYYDEATGRSELVGAEGLNSARLPFTLCAIILAAWAVYGMVALMRKIVRRTRGRRVAGSSPA